jgi:hypothetical protein
MRWVITCFFIAVVRGVGPDGTVCEDVNEQAVDAVLLPGSHWLRTSPDWVMGVSAMSSHAKDESKHTASTVLDHNDRTWWDIVAYSNQWVTFDLGIDATLSMVSFKKRNKGGIHTGRWMMSPTAKGVFVPIKTVNFAVGCEQIIVGFNDTTARYWKFQVLKFHRGVSQTLPDLAELGFFGRFEKMQPGSNIVGLEEPATESKCPCVHDNRVTRQLEIAKKPSRTADMCCALCIRTLKCKSWVFMAHQPAGTKGEGVCSLQSKLVLKDKSGSVGATAGGAVVKGYLCHGESEDERRPTTHGVAAGAGVSGTADEGLGGISHSRGSGGNGANGANSSLPLGHPQLGGSKGDTCFRTVHMVMELQGLLVSHLKLVLLLVSQWVGVTLQQVELQGIESAAKMAAQAKAEGREHGRAGGSEVPRTRFEIDVSSPCSEAPTVQQKMREMKQTPARFEEYVQLEAIARKICKVCFCSHNYPLPTPPARIPNTDLTCIRLHQCQVHACKYIRAYVVSSVGIGGSAFVQDSAYRQREARKEQQQKLEETDAMAVKRAGFERAAMAPGKEREAVCAQYVVWGQSVGRANYFPC